VVPNWLRLLSLLLALLGGLLLVRVGQLQHPLTRTCWRMSPAPMRDQQTQEVLALQRTLIVQDHTAHLDAQVLSATQHLTVRVLAAQCWDPPGLSRTTEAP